MAFTKFYGLGLIFLCLVLCNNGVEGTTREGPARNKASLKKYSRGTTQFQEGNYISDGISIADLPERVGHFAEYRSSEGQWGTQAELDVYGLPEVQVNQYSSASIHVVNGLDGPSKDFNSISAGWHVYPKLYNDTDTHFYTYWTAGSKAAGCYNLLCKGFVLHANASVRPGFKIRPLSVYNGDQYVIKVKIHKDVNTGDWWLHFQDMPIGYWPKSLFTSLSENAQEITWGGAVSFNKNEKSPPMGSGHFPEEGERRAASIRNIRFVDKHGDLYDLTADNESSYVDKTDCYRLGNFLNGPHGFKFYFGGVGGILGGCRN